MILNHGLWRRRYELMIGCIAVAMTEDISIRETDAVEQICWFCRQEIATLLGKSISPITKTSKKTLYLFLCYYSHLIKEFIDDILINLEVYLTHQYPCQRLQVRYYPLQFQQLVLKKQFQLENHKLHWIKNQSIHQRCEDSSDLQVPLLLRHQQLLLAFI